MTQEDKELLLQDLCARLSYGVKILHTGWDCDSDTDFDTIETLIGIDDKFIYTVWDKTGDREKHCLSVSNWKPYLRPMSSMTEEEAKELLFIRIDSKYDKSCAYIKNSIKLVEVSFQKTPPCKGSISVWFSFENKIHDICSHTEYLGRINDITLAEIDWLNKHHFDYRGLIERGLAIEAPEDIYN